MGKKRGTTRWRGKRDEENAKSLLSQRERGLCERHVADKRNELPPAAPSGVEWRKGARKNGRPRFDEPYDRSERGEEPGKRSRTLADNNKVLIKQLGGVALFNPDLLNNINEKLRDKNAVIDSEVLGSDFGYKSCFLA
ncbi:hypothetical protein WN48_09519 [Eufriesea mexicana]|nr:hypothetical protein WN48_09519 [Eufriesea mexicana]